MKHPSTLNKVAAITLSFWVAKVIATTLGETAGDFLAHTLGLGYTLGLAITGALLIAVLITQIRSKTYHPAIFWAAIVATTTAGTEISDLMDRTLGLGYVGGSSVLFAGLLGTLAIWLFRKGSLSVDFIDDRETELFFWVAVLFSNSLGTAFGDAIVDVLGFSYMQGAMICSAVIGVVLVLHYLTSVNTVLLFWAAFIFTRPFGATFGDMLSKPVAKGGLELGTLETSIVAAVLLIAVLVTSSWLTPAAKDETVE
jgi:uncharacterized membrane-anchored protein